jgi:hypothetical protein
VDDNNEVLSFYEGAELILTATQNTLAEVEDSWDKFYTLFNNVVRFGITGGPAKTDQDRQFNALIAHDFVLGYILTRRELGATNDIELFKTQFYKNYENILKFDTARNRSTAH